MTARLAVAATILALIACAALVDAAGRVTVPATEVRR